MTDAVAKHKTLEGITNFAKELVEGSMSDRCKAKEQNWCPSCFQDLEISYCNNVLMCPCYNYTKEI